MVNSIHYFSLLLVVLIGPLLLGLSLLYRRQFKQVIQSWQKPQIVIYTILNFVVSLSLFVMSSFFLAIYFGQIQELKIADIPNPVLGQLGLDALLMLAGTSLIYVAMHNFYTQFIGKRGIYFTNFNWRRLSVATEHFSWEAIKDYYVHSDYPVTQYNFLIKEDDGSFIRRTLRVPFYAQARFRSILLDRLDWQEELEGSSESISRKFSQN